MTHAFVHYTRLMVARRAPCALLWRNSGWRAFAYMALFAGVAHAGHAPLVPEPRTILLRADQREHVVVGTRRGGYFVTRDAGTTWSWLCEAAVGYDDEEVYPGVLLASGTLVVSTGFGGVAVSPDGCGWTPWQPSAQPFVVDVRAWPAASDTVVALEARADGDGFVNQLWHSADEAQTWQALGAPFAGDARAVSLGFSNSGEIYVAVEGPLGAELLRSTAPELDWMRTTITSALGVTPRVVGASESAGSARLFVVLDSAQAEGLTTPGDRLVMSLDRGESFTPLLDAAGDLPAAALSGDGELLAAGGESDGLYLLRGASQALSGAVMEQVASIGVHALAWSSDSHLYVAAHEAESGFSVGVSADEGQTFAALFALCQVEGPLACAADTSVGALCQSSGETGWDVRKEVADPEACAEVAAAGAAGSGSHSHPRPGEPAAAGAAMTVDEAATEATSSKSSSGGCAVSRSSEASAFLLTLLAVLSASFGRRRNRAR